jgi:Flp pilus assembly pilin Flp
MTRLLRQLWRDDDGAVVSVELVLIIAILIFGLIPGLVALRNSGISFMATLGNMMNALIPSFTFSGFAIYARDQNGNTTTFVQVDGVSFTPTPQNLTGAQIPPTPASAVVVPPAP